MNRDAVRSEESLAILAFRPLTADSGTRRARLEMTILANLLEHPKISPGTIQGALLEDRAIKRSNMDLGHVLATARMSTEEEIATWPAAWEEALKQCFPSRWESLAARAGAGLRALLDSKDDMREAYDSCVNSLLASSQVTLEQLRATGLRLVQDAIEPLERSAGGWDHSPPG